MDASDWIAIGSGCLALVAIVVSVVVALSQRALSRREQLFAVAGDLLTEFRAANFKERIKYIELSLAKDSPPTPEGEYVLSAESWAIARTVMSYFNNVGLLVYHGSISGELASSMMGGSVMDTWNVLAPYVYKKRELRGGDPNYYGYYEHLAATIRDLGPQRLEARLKLRKFPPGEAAKMVQTPPSEEPHR